ncbi:MAG: pirin family protein [Woeseiaceae bacterium]|nr:pirin family protein [Woeseiaceae bacterium]
MSALIELTIQPKTRDLGEFSVRRALPDRRRQRVGPFIFFDHMGPATFPPGTGVNVRSHPHIGLATVTYLFDGEILHRDSLGYVQPIRPGAVNWMTAGRGIVHSEKVTDETLASGQFLHGIQTWVALPAEREGIEPRFEHYPAARIPRVTRDGAEITVIIGEAYGECSPVQTESETLYLECRLAPGAALTLPETEELAVYVVDGEVRIGDDTVTAGSLAVTAPDAIVELRADVAAHAMVCGGASLDGERFIEWNFVSSSREKIERAKEDWAARRFDDVPGEEDFIPLPGTRI